MQVANKNYWEFDEPSVKRIILDHLASKNSLKSQDYEGYFILNEKGNPIFCIAEK